MEPTEVAGSRSSYPRSDDVVATGSTLGIAELLVTVPPREHSGAEATERFEFQLHWAVTELLQRQREGKDYCILLEYHDDVVLLDAAAEPTHADFYQVKSKRSGHWKTAELVRPGGKEKTELSTIGKLYTHRINFPSASIGLHFVSNVPLGDPLADGSNPNNVRVVRCTDLAEAHRAKLVAAVRRDHELPDDSEIDLPDITAFLFCTFSPAGAKEHVLGELETFLEELFPERQIGPSPIYKTLLAELRRRNLCRDRPDSPSALIRLHGFTRSQFDELLRRAGVQDDTAAEWNSIDVHMVAADWPPAERFRVRSAWRQYVARRTAYSDHQLQQLRMDLQARASVAMRRDDLNLRGLVGMMLPPSADENVLRALYGSDFLTAAALAELVIASNAPIQLPSAGQPSPDGGGALLETHEAPRLHAGSDPALPPDDDVE